MSSGVWEIVGKNKKNKNNGKTSKLTKAEKKKFIENAPKVEDFLPLNQVKTLYDNLDSNKENEKPRKEKENKTRENEERRKQKQSPQQQMEKKKPELRERPPKSIEEAIGAINTEEVADILEASQAHFPNAPLIWLKDLVSFLNAKIAVEQVDPVFSGRPTGYPLLLLPKQIRSTLERAIEMAGHQNVQHFYESTLIAMTSEMAKGTPVVGYKIFLQLLAQRTPELMISNIPKLITLRNSYQNRKPIGLSLLWTLAQSGVKNLTISLRVWHEVMAPMLESRNYASYVLGILDDFVSCHKNIHDLDAGLYLVIMDDIYSGKLKVPATSGKELSSTVEKLRSILFKNTNVNCRKLFETLMGKLTPTASTFYKEELIRSLGMCFTADLRCYSIWKSIYAKNPYQSNLILQHFDDNWDDLYSTLNVKALAETLTAFEVVNEGWKKAKRKEEYFRGCMKRCEALKMKMTVSNKVGQFPWKKGSLLLLVIIATILALDCKKHGSFEASSTGKFLSSSGILVQGQSAWLIAKRYSKKGLEYIEASAPEYYKATVDFTVPYIKLAGDLYLVAKGVSIKIYSNIVTYANQMGPVVAVKIEQYAPGFQEEAQKQYFYAVEQIKFYSAVAGEQIVERSTMAIQWVESNVFVGNLSPENLRSYASRAINTTQSFASQTYDWVYEKVQTLSKVQ